MPYFVAIPMIPFGGKSHHQLGVLCNAMDTMEWTDGLINFREFDHICEMLHHRGLEAKHQTTRNVIVEL